MSLSRYLIGIDLGTTNSAVAYVDTTQKQLPIHLFRISQLNGQGAWESLPLLPSFCYLTEDQGAVVGEWAREQGAQIPTRLIHSAKSWLSHAAAARKDKILPMEAADPKERLSPVEAISKYLAHLKDAWNKQMGKEDPERQFQAQQIVVTIPASFDEAARELTLQAARKVDLPHVTLLEEPQAAFYSWLAEHENQGLKEGETILVCDVGGGTTDFSLIQTAASKEGMSYQRVAVGEHLLLGGDNMDAALAYALAPDGTLDTFQRLQLGHEVRRAKEALLSGQSSVSVWLGGKGSKVIQGGRSFTLDAEMIQKLLVEGFFGLYSFEEAIQLRRGNALRSMGLPYEQEPSITKHLAHFLFKNKITFKPTYLLFNGGALKPKVFQDRIIESLNRWFVGDPLKVLNSTSLDLAVARGAAYFGKAKRGLAIRIGGGLPRTYYLGIEVEGIPQAVTLLPRQTEEEKILELDLPFMLRANAPVAFQLYHSHTRLGDAAGSLIQIQDEELAKLPPISTVLRYGKQKEADLPVRIEAQITAIGTLDVWVKAKQTEHAWKLEFQIEGQREKRVMDEIADATTLTNIKAFVNDAFAVGGKEKLKSLMADLEKMLEKPRGEWSPSILRALFDSLLQNAHKRELSHEYETRFWNLAGFFLRPGKGYPLDDFRMKEIWKLLLADLKKRKSEEIEIQKCICLRRIAAGLSKGQQIQIFNELLPHIYDKRRQRLNRAEYRYAETLRTVASFEYIDPAFKVKCAQAIVEKILAGKAEVYEFWALGRLCARQLLYGTPADIVDPKSCEELVEKLIRTPHLRSPHLPMTLAIMARKIDLLGRNLSPKVLELVAEELKKHQLNELLEPERALSSREEEWVFGDSLPLGLRL